MQEPVAQARGGGTRSIGVRFDSIGKRHCAAQEASASASG
jgi:hypothetical protein